MAGEQTTYGTPLKIVEINHILHELLPKYIQDADGNPKTWADILAVAAEAGIELVSLNALPAIPADPDEAAALYAQYRKSLVFVPSSNPGTQNIKDEYIIQRTGTEGSYSYSWEQVGSTELDLSGYVQKGVTYNGAALSNGSHTHTVTVPTVSVDKTKKLGATATGTTLGTSIEVFVKSYPGVTSKMVTTSVKGVDGTTTASKATAGTAITLATRAASQTTVGNANVGEAVSIPNVTGNTTVNATNIATPSVVTVKQVNTVTNGTAASFTQGAKAAWSANVDEDTGVLSFSFTPNGNDTFVANTPTAVSTTNVTGVVKSGAATPSATAVTASNVTLGTAISVTPATASTTKIYGVGGTQSVTPYTFADVTVPVAAESATTVATGSLAANGSGASVMTGLGTPSTAEAIDQVAVINEPTITITEDTTNTGPVNEHVTTGTASATTSSDGAHTHNINVAE